MSEGKSWAHPAIDSRSSASLSLLASVCGAAFIWTNGLFYWLSYNYFKSHHELVAGQSMPSYTDAQMLNIRISFAVFTGVIIAGVLLAVMRARIVGHALAWVLGVVNLVLGVAAEVKGLPSALGVTLMVAGVLMPVLAWQSMRGGRAAWAFLFTICAVFAVAELFGAPKIRAGLTSLLGLDIGLWVAMIFPGINLIAAVALIRIRNAYVEHSPVPA